VSRAETMSRLRRARVQHRPGARYVLVTQCLQNDFFLNPECRLGLPEFIVREMLLGKRHLDPARNQPGHRQYSPLALARGPLGQLLRLTIHDRMKRRGADGTLHVINIRDWHCAGSSYDHERRFYGRHCEEQTWGAAYIDGLARYLDPNGSSRDERCSYFSGGTVRIYHIHSDTLFDFKPRAENIGAGPSKLVTSELEDLLDVIVQGTDEELECLDELMSKKEAPAKLRDECKNEPMAKELAPNDLPEWLHLLAGVVAKSEPEGPEDVHLAAIGVYTDIKVKTLLTGIRTRYELTNIAVSDTFTTSQTLERHLSGLDYAKKVLGIEVIHGINDLVRFLGGTREVKNEKSRVAAEHYSSYEHFFQDQQNVLAYQNQALEQYLALTERRALRVYDLIRWTNLFLILWGAAFLVATLVLVVLRAIMPDEIAWELPVVTGGLSLAQFVGVFFTGPTNDLQRNLTNLARFKMVLESHSLKTAIMRFHLTTARTLRPMENAAHAQAAARQIKALESQLSVIGTADVADYAGLGELGFIQQKARVAEGSVGAGDVSPTGVTNGEAAPEQARSQSVDRPSRPSHA
jgi:hypothetical protein